MNKVKIVHASDFHFDTPFKDIGEKQRKINKEELKEVFRNIIHYCRDNSVDILLLSGDIFDNYTINKETLIFIEDTLRLIKEVRVFISPGNHDPYSNNSFYKLVNWPDNVYIFKSNIEKVHIKELGVNIWGAAFNEKYVRSSYLKGFNCGSNDEINIMVLHGEISNSKNGNEYNPITIEEIGKSGLDYLALGHRHGYSGINNSGGTYYAYSGCPQGRGFDELDEKGIISGYVYKGGVDLEFNKTSLREYKEVKIDITDSKTYEEIKEKIVCNFTKEERERNLYKIILVGELNSSFAISEDIIFKKVEDNFYYCKIKDKTSYKYDLEEIAKGYSVKSIYIKKLIEEMNNAETEKEKEVISMALKYGIASLCDEEVQLDDY